MSFLSKPLARPPLTLEWYHAWMFELLWSNTLTCFIIWMFLNSKQILIFFNFCWCFLFDLLIDSFLNLNFVINANRANTYRLFRFFNPWSFDLTCFLSFSHKAISLNAYWTFLILNYRFSLFNQLHLLNNLHSTFIMIILMLISYWWILLYVITYLISLFYLNNVFLMSFSIWFWRAVLLFGIHVSHRRLVCDLILLST